MSRITGAGCLLSAVAGAFLAVADENQLNAVATALAFYKQAGEYAAAQSSGPGHFAVHFLNALYAVNEEYNYPTGGVLK